MDKCMDEMCMDEALNDEKIESIWPEFLWSQAMFGSFIWILNLAAYRNQKCCLIGRQHMIYSTD
jgi:hypothetical protein